LGGRPVRARGGSKGSIRTYSRSAKLCRSMARSLKV
jgi:hypothetical protein